MPKLNDHGLGGGGKVLGVPVYPHTNDGVLYGSNSGTYREFKGPDGVSGSHYASGDASSVKGDEFYILGGRPHASCVKYNVKTKIWTTIASADDYERTWAVTIGDDIYYNSTTYIKKYDTVNNKHSSVVKHPGNLIGSRAVADSTGENIYIFGGESGYGMNAYKFNISNNTFTKLTDVPSEADYHSVIYGYNNKIYIFGGTTNPQYAYEYNPSTDSYTQLTNIPMRYYNGLIACIRGFYQYQNIYLINTSNTSYAKYAYVYHITKKTYTRLSNTTYNRYNGHAGVIDNVIYMIGGSNATETVGAVESMFIIQAIDRPILRTQLLKNTKIYTDGPVRYNALNEILGLTVMTDGTAVKRVDGMATIPDDNEYVMHDASYVTIGG